MGTGGYILKQIYIIRENSTKPQNCKFNTCNITFLKMNLKEYIRFKNNKLKMCRS